MRVLFVLGLIFFSSGLRAASLEVETQQSRVCFLDNGYLIKQVKNPDPSEQFLLVLDATACAIAESIDLPINRVKLLPANTVFSGKKYFERPATLHAVVPGHSIPEDEDDREIRIHQRTRQANDCAKWPLPPQREGLNYSVVEHMAKHEDLPGIVALDTFVGNADRSQPNIFYDAVTNRYFGIDLAASFCAELAKVACAQVQRFEAQKHLFSAEELAGLTRYVHTLERLLARWTPEAMERLLVESATFAGFVEESALWNQDVEERILFHKDLIQSNYMFTVELVQRLKVFLKA